MERQRLGVWGGACADTRPPVKRIAARCGFGWEEMMRGGFLHLLANTLEAYRERFAITRAAVEVE